MLEPLETSNWRAFELATAALRDMDASAVRRPPDRSLLQSAGEKLKAAVAQDPKFLRARYYAAVVDELLGKSKEAAAALKSVVEQKPSFHSEAQYNLAVSHYHFYTPGETETALREFQDVQRTASNQLIRLLAGAGMVRCYAMNVHFHERADKLDEAKQEFEAALSESEVVLAQLGSGPPDIYRKRFREIEWRVRNGRGVAYMYWSDFYRPDFSNEAEIDLKKALEDFHAADRLSPDNWEIVCNLGSANMRLSRLYRSENRHQPAGVCFRDAQRFLTEVIERLWPEYAFALLELGRLERIAGDPKKAISWFERSQAVPREVNDVSPKSLNEEREAAERGDITFPLKSKK